MALLVGLSTVGGPLLLGVTGQLPGRFSTMVALGPLMAVQYAVWRWHGPEQTTGEYRRREAAWVACNDQERGPR